MRTRVLRHCRRSCLAGLVGALSTACVHSIEPVIRAEDATREDRLLGHWRAADSGAFATVMPDGEHAYRIRTLDEKGREAHFEARHAVLGGRRLLELHPLDDAFPDAIAPYGAAVRPLRVLLDVQFEEGGGLQLALLDPDSVRARVRRLRPALPFSEEEEDFLVLTAPTATLRAALARALRAPGLWSSDPMRYVRSATGPASHFVRQLPPCVESSPWRDADALFRSDPRWRGGDVATSIDLGGGRSLWLFGDSFIDTTGRGDRRLARMVRNSIGISTGADPSRARMTFHWRTDATGGPGDFFPGDAQTWYWPGAGVRLDGRVIVFLTRVTRSADPLGFRALGWRAVLIENPDDEPGTWRLRWLETPPDDSGILLGFTGALVDGEWLYAYGALDAVASRPVYAARWPLRAAREGRLAVPEWHRGRHGLPDSLAGVLPRQPVLDGGQSELAVIRDARTGQHLMLQTTAFGSADLALRAAETPFGPWSEPRMVHRPSEHGRRNVMLYAAKLHPQLGGADFVATYASNSTDFLEVLADESLYFPRFVRLDRCP